MFYAILNIKAQTIQLQKPLICGNGIATRIAVAQNTKAKQLISYETFLRRTAYKNTSIQTTESFFDDSDMLSDYFIVVIYDKKTNTPLLSARYFYNRVVINNCLKGDENNEDVMGSIALHTFKDEEVFLSDRLSGNINSAVYRAYRNYIFLLFYFQILICNRKRKFILMARKEKQDKLQKKYLQLGLNTVGLTKHKGKEHWILFGDVEHCYKHLKIPFAFKLMLKIKILIHKLTANDKAKN